MRGLSAAKTPPRAPNAALAFLRCARYRVHARPRARAPRSVGARGALRRLRRLGWRPRRPGARQPRHESVAGRARARGSRPRARGRAARPAPRVQRPRRRAPRRRGPARGPAAGRRPGAGAAPRRAAADLCAEARRGAATTSPASGAVRPRKGAARPCKRLLLRCAAGSSVSPTARHAARRIIEGYWTLSGALFFVSCNWFCESVTVGARRDFFFARTAFVRVRTPGTDQTTRKRVSRRSTSNKRGTPDRRAVNIAS